MTRRRFFWLSVFGLLALVVSGFAVWVGPSMIETAIFEGWFAGKPWDTIIVTDAADATCSVAIYSAPYADDTRVTILWDEKTIFSGRLPRSKDPMKVPVYLLAVETVPGEHVLAIIHKKERVEKSMVLKSGATHYYFIFGSRGMATQEMLEDWGTEVPMWQ